MKVKDLINELLEQPMDAEVIIDAGRHDAGVEEVSRYGGYSSNRVELKLTKAVRSQIEVDELVGVLEEINDSDMAQREEDEGNVSEILKKSREVVARATA